MSHSIDVPQNRRLHAAVKYNDVNKQKLILIKANDHYSVCMLIIIIVTVFASGVKINDNNIIIIEEFQVHFGQMLQYAHIQPFLQVS